MKIFKFFIALLMISIVFVSCDKETIENMKYDNNIGIIFSPISDNDIEITNRNIYIEKTKGRYHTVTDIFDIRGTESFYYPVLIDGLDDDFLSTIDDYNGKLLFTGKVSHSLENVKNTITSFDFSEDNIPKDRPLTVYEIKLNKTSEEMKGENSNIAVFIPIEYENNVYTYGFNGFDREDEHLVYFFSVPRSTSIIESKFYIIFDKEFTGDFDIKSYETGALENETDDLDYQLIKNETTLYTLMNELYKNSIIEGREITSYLDKYIFNILDGSMNAFDEKNPSKNFMNNLTDLIINDLYKRRIVYLKFDIDNNEDTFKITRNIYPSDNHYRKNSFKNNLKEYYIISTTENAQVHIKDDFDIKGIFEGDSKINIEDNKFKLKKDVNYRIDFSK